MALLVNIEIQTKLQRSWLDIVGQQIVVFVDITLLKLSNPKNVAIV